MKILLIIFTFSSLAADAQIAYNFFNTKHAVSSPAAFYPGTAPAALKRKLYQRNSGMILGLQRGRFTSIELGGEAHWRKISLFRPHIVGATVNMEYNLENNILGYKAGLWMKRGRLNLTYGANVNYFTNFNEGHRFGIGPSVGFRFFGLHLINGYTFLVNNNTKSDEPPSPFPVNTLYMSLRYYFPVDNKFTWDRKTMKKKKARKKEKTRRKKLRKKNNIHRDTLQHMDR